MKPPYPANHASFINRVPSGDMIMAWFSGSREGANKVSIVVSILPHNTTQWSDAKVVAQRDGYSNQNPVTFYDEQRKFFYLFHTQQKAKGLSEIYAPNTAFSEDSGGKTFHTPRLLFTKPGSFDRNRVLTSLNNSWLYPMYYAGGSSKEQHSVLKECFNGNVFATWLDHEFKDSSYLVQPSVVRPVPDKPQLVVFFRDRRAQNIYRATSEDDGKTWSSPAKTTLPNNNSGIEAFVLKSGKIAVVYNPTTHVRDPLVISLSEDEGKTWKYTTVLESSKELGSDVEYSYPTLFQDPAGQIHVSYTYNRQTIKHVVIPNEDWIMKKPLV